MLHLTDVATTVKTVDGGTMNITAEQLDSSILNAIVCSGQDDAYNQMIKFIRDLNMDEVREIVKPISKTPYAEICAWYDRYDELSEHEKLMLCAMRMKGLRMLCV